MTGSTPFLIEKSDNFQRSFKKLAKFHGKSIADFIAKVLEELIDDPYPNKSRSEPLPKGIQLSKGWTFHKLALRIAEGASGQIRLMYLVNSTTCIIHLVWIYSHEQFAKRPADVDIRNIIQDILD